MRLQGTGQNYIQVATLRRGLLTSHLKKKTEGVNYHRDDQKFLPMEHVNCFIFNVDECHYIAFIINKHYYAEISKVLAGYSITSIVQNVYWLLSKILLHLYMDPEYHNQVDKFTKNSLKKCIYLAYTTIGYFF